jgi:hypothetical protein
VLLQVFLYSGIEITGFGNLNYLALFVLIVQYINGQEHPEDAFVLMATAKKSRSIPEAAFKFISFLISRS